MHDVWGHILHVPIRFSKEIGILLMRSIYFHPVIVIETLSAVGALFIL
jgi:hypothetical protein